MHLRKWIVGITSLTFITLAACSSTVATEPSPEMINAEIEELHDQALSSEGWIKVAPGFRYRNHRGGTAFWITSSELTEKGLQQVEAHVQALERAATSDLEHFRLEEWKTRLEKARIAQQKWQTYWPKIQQEYREAVEKGVIPRSEDSVTLQPTSASCSLGASAMPTTASPGAKAYATANCSPGGAISGYVRTETTARAGNDWPPSCRDSGWSSSQCNSVAYGNSGCDSSALAEYYYEYGPFDIVSDARYDSNNFCT